MKQKGNSIFKETDTRLIGFDYSEASLGITIRNDTRMMCEQLNETDVEQLMYFLHKKYEFDSVPNVVAALRAVKIGDRKTKAWEDKFSICMDRNEELRTTILRLISAMEDAVRQHPELKRKVQLQIDVAKNEIG